MPGTLPETDVPALRKPWEVFDTEILPHLALDEAFGGLEGLRPDGQGRMQSCCPIHRGKEAAEFSVDPDRLEWICFAGCGGGGPIQFLQRTQGLTWIESAEALAVIAGVDASRIRAWGEHWTDKDFERHEQLESRSTLLRVFMALSKSLLLSAAGKTLRGYLQDKHALPAQGLSDVELGLYPTPQDVFHYLKRTGLDVGELKARGFFESHWEGRIVAPWRDLSGRTVNLWSWDVRELGASPSAPRMEVLFQRDLLGSQKTPFQLDLAAQQGKRDLLLVDNPLQAILPTANGLQDPFPISSNGALTQEQVDVLNRFLERDGTLTLMASYDPERAGSPSDRTQHNLKLLEEGHFPVFVVNSSLLAGEDLDMPVTLDSYIKDQGFPAFLDLIKQCEVRIAPQNRYEPAPPQSWPGVTQMVEGTNGPSLDTDWDPAAAGYDAQIPPVGAGPFFDALLKVVEEIGNRIAQGLAMALPGAAGTNPLLAAGTTLALGSLPQAALPPASIPDEDMPPPFSVDRLEELINSSATSKSSGWPTLDRLGVRFRAGELAAVGGPTAHGKTSTLVGILTHWLNTPEPTDEVFVYCSLDESEVQMYFRILSLVTALDGSGWTLNGLRDHRGGGRSGAPVSESNPEALESAKARLRSWESRLRLVHRPRWSLEQLEQFVHQLAETNRIGGVLLDPMPLPEDLEEGFSAAQVLKRLASELECPVVVGLNTGALEPPSAKALPKSSDPSGDFDAQCGEVDEVVERQHPQLDQFDTDIVRRADVILGLLNYSAVYDTILRGEVEVPKKTRFDISVLKNRSGDVEGIAELRFDRRFCQLVDSHDTF